MPLTRLTPDGYGGRRAGDFSGKTPEGGDHPVGQLTRLGPDGYGVRRAGSFAGKTPSAGTHPVGVLTRLAADGYGARRAGSFAGKTAAAPEPPPDTGPPPAPAAWGPVGRQTYPARPVRRRPDDDEAVALALLLADD